MKKPRGRPRGSAYLAYKLLMLLMYGQHSWIERTSGQTRVPIATLARHLKTRSHKIHEYLDQLETWGFVSFKWYKHYASVTVVPPVGMEYVYGSSVLEHISTNVTIESKEAIEAEKARLISELVAEARQEIEDEYR